MTDDPTIAAIRDLADEEHVLRQKEATGDATDEDRARIAELDVQLDRCWDLLRQRRARRDAGLAEDGATERSESTVEGYLQ